MNYKQIVQIIALDTKNRHYEPDITNSLWHAVLGYAGPRTVCGIQLDGDDGYGPGPITNNGLVDCPNCMAIINEIIDHVG